MDSENSDQNLVETFLESTVTPEAYEPTPQKFTLLEKTSYFVAKRAINQYDLHDFKAFETYLESLNEELRTSIADIVICQFRRSDIFASELMAQCVGSDVERQREKMVEQFTCFNRNAQLELFEHLATEIFFDYMDEQESSSRTKILIAFVEVLIQKNRDDKNLLACFFGAVPYFQDKKNKKIRELFINLINSQLEPVLNRWSENHPLIVYSNNAEEMVEFVIGELSKNGPHEATINFFNLGCPSCKAATIRYILCCYGCEKVEQSEEACETCLVLLDLEAILACLDLTECSQKLLARALLVVIYMYRIFNRAYPDVIDLFETNSFEYLSYCREKNARVRVLWKIYDCANIIAPQVITRAIGADNSQKIQKVLSLLPKYCVIAVFKILLSRSDRLLTCSPETQQKNLEMLLESFLPFLTGYSKDNPEKQAEMIYCSFSIFYYDSYIQEPLTSLFRKYLIKHKNSHEAQDLLERLAKLYSEDINRIIQHKKIETY